MCAELIGTAFADRLYKKEYEMIQENILELVKYGLSTGLVDPEDKVYTINRLLELFQVDEIEDAVFEKVENLPAWTQEEAEGKLEGILAEMMDYAYENGLMAENSIVYKDLFDTKIMGCLVPEPSSVRKTFRDLYEHTSPLAATDYFYKLSCDSNYIRRQRIKRTASGQPTPSLEHWISPSICPNRRKIQKPLRQQKMQSRARIRSASSVRKMRDMQDVSTIRHARTTASFH